MGADIRATREGLFLDGDEAIRLHVRHDHATHATSVDLRVSEVPGVARMLLSMLTEGEAQAPAAAVPDDLLRAALEEALAALKVANDPTRNRIARGSMSYHAEAEVRRALRMFPEEAKAGGE